jgi:superfamily II DNA or RNA helicase
MSFLLFEHNRIAYDAAISMLAETGKAAIIHPTGTGKSFIGFKLCEDNPDSKICWLSPSEYIFQTQVENLTATGADMPENIVFYTYTKLIFMSNYEVAGIQPDYIILDEDSIYAIRD